MRYVSVILVLCLSAFAQGPTYPYSVALSFTASTGTVTGYNMYRAAYTSGACGSYTKLNATPFTGTTYTDSNPPQGFYCYAATAVDGTQESGYSNIDSNISIPPAPPTGLGATVATGTYTNNATFAWTQSTSPTLTKNSLWCSTSPTTGLNRRWESTTPVTTGTISLAKGTHYCAVTAIDHLAESGLSVEIPVVVN